MFQAAEKLLRALNDVSFFDLYFKQDIVPYISVNPHISCRFRIYTLQRGRLRAAALSRRRKLRFSAACQSNPPALLRYVSSSQKIFALQIFFGSPVLLSFPCCSCCLFRGVCLAAAGEARRTRLCLAHATVPNRGRNSAF